MKDTLKYLLFGLLAKFLKNLKTTSKKMDKRPFDEIYNDNGIFVYQDNAFKINFESGPMDVNWDDIQTVFGYKVDLYTLDCICADIFCSNNKSFKINEETAGWFQFMIHLSERFPNVEKNWDIRIATPAFETNLTLVYDRENRNLEEALGQYYKTNK